MSNEINNNDLRVPLILLHLKELTSKENMLYSLTALNKIISTSKDEIEFFCKSEGIQLILDFLKSDNDLVNICLKILANASRRKEKIRSELLNNNIFCLLTDKLKEETDFTKSNFILMSALIVLLVQGNYEAQILMRSSGCLSSMVRILSCILGKTKNEQPPCKCTELIIYTIIASSKSPRQPENQTKIGSIIPKVLEFVEKQTLFTDFDQFQVLKCLWLFLQCSLDRNDINQEIFIKHSGVRVLFRSIQDAVHEERCDSTGHFLAAIADVLVTLKSNKDFLSQASNYCPLMILCSLLKTRNTPVVQQVIVFLESLATEIPPAFQIIKNKDVVKEIKRAKILFRRSLQAAKLCQSLLNRMERSDGVTSRNEFNANGQFRFTSCRRDLISGDFDVKHTFLKNYSCVLHDTEPPSQTESVSSTLSGSSKNADRTADKGNKSLGKIRSSAGDLLFHKKKSREREKNLKVLRVLRNFFRSMTTGASGLSIGSVLGEKVCNIFQNLRSFFPGKLPLK